MGLSSCSTQPAVFTFVLIVINLCQVIGTSSMNAPNESTTTNSTTPTTTNETVESGSTNNDTSEAPTDALYQWTSPTENSTTFTTEAPKFWVTRYVVICGVSVLALMIVFGLVPQVSITMDRLYSRRKRETVTLNRMDRIVGTQLRMSPGLRLDLHVDGSVDDDSVLMMPEQLMAEPVQRPVSADQTTHHPVEDAPIGVSPRREIQVGTGHYEECKFARASAESLDLLMDMSDLEEAKSTRDAEALRFRSYSADPSSSTTNQPKYTTTRLYSNPERDRKGGNTLPEAPVDMNCSISITGMDDLRDADCSSTTTSFVREESVDMYGPDSPTSADCKNESFIHSPSASAVVAYHEKLEKPAADSNPPRNALSVGPHVYEELKDMRTGNEAATSEENEAAPRRDDCKITFPQYFQLNDRVIEDARAAAGHVKPRTAQTLPRQDVPYSVSLLATSPMDEFADVGNANPVRARRGTGIMAVMNQQHRLSDGALDDKARQIHEVINPYSSLHRQNVVPSMKPYSKLNRGPSDAVGGSPKFPSKNVYDKLNLTGGSDFTDQSQLHETRL